MFSLSLASIAFTNVYETVCPQPISRNLTLGWLHSVFWEGVFFFFPETLQYLTCEEKKTTLVDLRAAATPSAVRLRCLHRHFWSLGLLVCQISCTSTTVMMSRMEGRVRGSSKDSTQQQFSKKKISRKNDNTSHCPGRLQRTSSLQQTQTILEKWKTKRKNSSLHSSLCNSSLKRAGLWKWLNYSVKYCTSSKSKQFVTFYSREMYSQYTYVIFIYIFIY